MISNPIRHRVIEFADRLIALGTEWKQLKLEIDEESRRLVAVVRDSNDAITLQDLQGNILAWNRGAQRMYGWTEDEALEMNIRETLPESCRPASLDITMRLTQGEDISSYETQRITKDGRIVEVWLTITALKDTDDKIVAIATTERDITERKEREQEKERYLEEALANLKVLSGLLPICASCKKIRDDQGYWKQIETYIRDHSQATFTHGICPQCTSKYYPKD